MRSPSMPAVSYTDSGSYGDAAWIRALPISAESYHGSPTAARQRHAPATGHQLVVGRMPGAVRPPYLKVCSYMMLPM